MNDEFSLNELLIAEVLVLIIIALMLISKGCANG